MIQLADRNEQVVGQSGEVESAEHKAGSTKPAELFAQERIIERALARRRQSLFRRRRELLAAGLEHRLERTACLSEQPNINPCERRTVRRLIRERGPGTFYDRRGRCPRYAPSGRNAHRRFNRLPESTAHADGADGRYREPLCRATGDRGVLEPESIANCYGSGHLYKEVTPVETDDRAERLAAIVRLGSRDVVAASPTTVHAPRESAAVDLNEGLNLICCRRHPRRGETRAIDILGCFAETIQPFAI